jgi:hypothetical protein
MPEPGPITVDPHRCPLCGGPNGCAMATNPDAADCWCCEARIPDELLDRVPAEARDAACICARCVADANHSSDTPGGTS